MTTIVRVASPRAATRLLALIQDHAAFERSPTSLSIDALEAILVSESPAIHILVAEVQAVLAGYAALTFDYALWRGSRYGHLDCLFVTETARYRGIGQTLLDAAKHRVLTEGLDRLEWQTPAWNTDAIRFYLREGALGVTKERFAIKLG